MSKKIRFPLKMANGADVRTIEELRENFDLESVLGYYANGKLITWLSDRYYDIESKKIQSLVSISEDLNKRICEILGVEYTNEYTNTDIEALRIRNEKIAMLKQITDKQEIIEAVDSVAFDQDELFDLLDEDTEVIYLYGEKFSIPLGKGNVKYIGVNNPLILLEDNSLDKYQNNNISFEELKFDDNVITITESKSEEEKMLDEFLKAEKISDLRIKEKVMKKVMDMMNILNSEYPNLYLHSFTKKNNTIIVTFGAENDNYKSYFIEI